jgi:hypothetical protein
MPETKTEQTEYAPEQVLVSERLRLSLYILMSILPVWQDFFTKSLDFTLRGLAMPIISSMMSAVTVMLARTTARKRSEPVMKDPAQITTTVTELKEPSPTEP